MSVISSDIQQSVNGKGDADGLDRLDRAAIDASARIPVLFIYGSAVFWLLVQTVFSLIVSLKIQWPQFLADCSALTYGRIVPAQSVAMVYGWASLAGIGTAVWILARLCRVALPKPGLLLIGTSLWNLSVAFGIIGVLAGNGRGFEFLEMPHGAMSLLFLAYSLIAVWGFVVFQNRRSGHIYIAAWYLIAALVWFPWLVGVGNFLVSFAGLSGIMKAVVASWVAQNLIGLWLTAVGLGAVYYLIPKVLGRPIHSYFLALFGFWGFAIISCWTGLQRLSGGPVPAWLVTVSIVATLLLMIPVVTVSANFFLTLREDFGLVYKSPTIRFVAYGAVAYLVASFALVFGSFRSVSAISQFTWFGAAQNQLFLMAFFSMVMFGAFYYIVPRLTGSEWLSPGFIRLHFFGSGYGFAMSAIVLALGGLVQGASQASIHITDPASPHSDFLLSVLAMLPWMRGRNIAQILVLIGNFSFVVHFVLMLVGLGRPSGKPTLLEPSQKGAH